ncbi:MAG TPA: hypothetical protein VFB63_01705 [Bryobacteraceae bacterium]|nr:hypothetical protein [Bryobacteraceae bacterium]
MRLAKDQHPVHTWYPSDTGPSRPQWGRTASGGTAAAASPVSPRVAAAGSRPSGAAHALPTIYPNRDFVEVGGLMSYGSSPVEQFRQNF